MFESKRIETLERRNKKLVEDNKRLNKLCSDLQTEIRGLQEIVEAADKYTEEHRIAMRAVAESRERYELAYRQMMKVKKEYETRMEKVLKGFE